MTTIRHSLQRYPLIIITLCYAAGIAVSSFYPAAPEPVPYTVAILLILALICWRFRLNGLLLFLIGICFLLIGAMHATQRRSFSAEPFSGLALINEKRETVILGTITEIEAGNEQVSRAVIDLQYFRTRSMQHFKSASGLILMSLQGSWPRTILPGDTVSVRSVLMRPRVNNTPGVFDYPQYLAGKNIFLRAAVRSPLFIQPVRIAGKPDQHSWRQRVERIRALVAFRLNDLLPANAAGLYRALLIGDKSGLRPYLT